MISQETIKTIIEIKHGIPMTQIIKTLMSLIDEYFCNSLSREK